MSQTDPLRAKSDFSALFRLWPYMRPYKAKMAQAMLALLVAGSTVLVIVGGLRYVIDQGFVSTNESRLDQTLIALLVAIIVLAASTFWRYSAVTWLGERVISDLRFRLYKHLLTLGLSYFESARAGDVLARMSSDTTLLQSLVGSTLSVALRNCVLLIGGVVMMLMTSPKLTMLVMLVIPVVLVPIIVLGRKVRVLSRRLQEQQAEVNAGAEETIFGIRTIQAFNQERSRERDYWTRLDQALDAADAFIHQRAWLTAIVISLVFASIGVVLWIGGHDVLSHVITAGQLSAFVGFSVIAATSSGAISEAMGDFNRAAAAAERIFALLDTKADIACPANPHALPDAKGELVFENVSFSYPSRPDHPILRNISFSIKPGERVAIVGPSGAGKTTLYQLALRFYDPQQGRILLDGVDIKTADPQIVRTRIGLVPQEPVIFSTDAAQNIGTGKEGATPAEIRSAAQLAHADEFITNLAQGYDTYLGEKGVRLSGGQKQRIAIARAILRNPSLLLLDEATSALDAESERLVQDAFEKLMQGRTTLIIAHRLATIKHVDRILVVDQGTIVEEGSHDELVRAEGLYARLAKLQFHGG